MREKSVSKSTKPRSQSADAEREEIGEIREGENKKLYIIEPKRKAIAKHRILLSRARINSEENE
jgi:hypothetical protein